jgi:hypothetical protein
MQHKKWEKGSLREDGKPGFETPTGKFEIASSVLDEYGYDPLPRYVEPKESPASQPQLANQFPLVFNSGARHNVDLHTLHHSIPSLTKERPVPTVMMNVVDAARRGINSGDKVLIRTPRGQVAMYAVVTDDIVEGAVEASGAGGGALGSADWQKACVNELTDLNNYDPISGFPTYKVLLCDITRVEHSEVMHIVASGEYLLDNKVEKGMTASRIYLDNNATTALDTEVQTAMMEFAKCYGNPSSIYAAGRESHDAIEAARKSLSLLINCTPRRLIFNSGGSEGNNFVIKGIAGKAGIPSDLSSG